jgi:hypothetical protein
VLLSMMLLASASAWAEESPAVSATDAASPAPLTPLTVGGKLRHYLDSTAGPGSLALTAFVAGYHQATDAVPEWGQGMEGYGKRYASSLGHKAVGHAARFGMQALLGEDPRYLFAPPQEAVRPRVWHAAKQTFLANKDGGGVRPNYSYFTSVAVGTYVSRQWRPEGDRDALECLQSAAVSVGVHTAKNVFKEFWPDIQRKLLKGRLPGGASTNR